MNLNHVQFSAELKRNRGKIGDPANPVSIYTGLAQKGIDPDHPYVNAHAGLFDGSVTGEDGLSRKFVFYIPTTMRTSGSMMIVFLPDGVDCRKFIDEYGWKEVLEGKEIAAYFVPAADEWDIENPGKEMDVAARVIAQMHSNEYFLSNAPAIYALGFGKGAVIASIFSILYTSVLAAWGAFGENEILEAALQQLGEIPSDCDAAVKRCEVGLPTILVEKNHSSIFNYYKKANKVEGKALFDGTEEVYYPESRIGETLLNDQNCRELRFIPYDGHLSAAIVARMVEFIDGFKSWGGCSNPDIRRNEHLYHHGLVLYEKKIDGLLRRWRVYEPTAHKREPARKLPLVIAIHGFSCSGPFFAENSGWHMVAEARDFFVVYPTAYPRAAVQSQLENGVYTPGMTYTPTWRTSTFAEISGTDIDDVSFISQMLDDIIARYPIDIQRIYVTGHSNGSGMTQEIMRRLPGRFAGFCGVGFMECINKIVPEPDDGVMRNIWYVIGEHDIHDCSLKGDNWNTRTLKMICAADKMPYDLSKHYQDGPYNTVVFSDANKVPLVRFTGVKNFPHSYTPELAYKIYDEFFSQFIRREDGKLEYLPMGITE